jgi:hypothetical protein
MVSMPRWRKGENRGKVEETDLHMTLLMKTGGNMPQKTLPADQGEALHP